MIKAVWFDIGGTVHVQDATLENDMAYAERLYQFLTAHGIETAETPRQLLEHIDIGAKAYKSYSEQELIELPSEEIWRDFMLKEFHVASEKLNGLGEDLSYMFDRFRKVITPREGLEETLRILKDGGFRLGVISNIMSRTFVPRILEEHGVAQYFEFIITSSEYRVRKPRRDLFDAAVSLMGITAREAAYVGDTISRDVRGTRAADWEMMIQIENPRISHKDAKYLNCGYQPDYSIRSLMEIPPIVQQFNTERKERRSD
jgi:putative hydrolase of the HAD superfamily